jgi:putative cardiolipin synthase
MALATANTRGRPSLPNERALPVHDDGVLDHAVLPLLDAHPGHTGFRLVTEGPESLAIRVLSARQATRSLDVQTYIWHDDRTGQSIARELLAAADRGVRVRLLLDGMDARANGFALHALDLHPRISVRLFNPMATARRGVRRLAQLLFGAARINHRMHNKVWIADQRIAVVGGRNIGDEYFAAHHQVNFLDLEFGVLGPAVETLAQSFDTYWNSLAVWPIDACGEAAPPVSRLERIRVELEADAARATATYDAPAQAANAAAKTWLSEQVPLCWTDRWQLLADDPRKALAEEAPLARSAVLRGLLDRLQRARHAVALVSPYFVPGPEGTALLVGLVERGITLTILTNSLAANDVAAVHGGYARYRPRLVDGGVQLWELKPDAGAQVDASLFGSSGASLHTKAALFDDAAVLVGSFNLDPRSVSLNCEQAMIVEDAELAAKASSLLDAFLRSDRAWRVQRLPGGKLVWKNMHQVLTHEPAASWTRRMVAAVLRVLPLDAQL